MPARELPNLGLQAFFDLGEDGWNDEYDLNFLKLSVVVQGGVTDKLAAEPAAPADKAVYILDETNATNPNAVAVYDVDTWKYITPKEGWLLYNRTADYYEKFDGVVWAELATGGAGGGLADAPSDGSLYARKDAAWQAFVPGAGGGGGGWELVTETVIGAAVPAVNVVGLAAYQDVMVVVEGVTASLAGQRAIQLSADNGATYDQTSANYNFIDLDGVVTDSAISPGFFPQASVVTAARSFHVILNNFGAAQRTWADTLRDRVYRHLPQVAQSALRIVNVSSGAIAGNLTGGTVRVFGRKAGSGGGGGSPMVALTQAEYDALATPDPDTFYFIPEA